MAGNSLRGGWDALKRRVAYFYDEGIGDNHYGAGHVMKPHRVRMTHSLLQKYGVLQQMEVLKPPLASFDQLSEFHSPDYVEFLRTVTYENQHQQKKELERFNMHQPHECPVFDDLYSFCQTSAGGSIAAAAKLNHQEADIVINWAGGLHHAKQFRASGFCFVNDVVLAILELLKYHQRVLYVDIDVHHGDGVEEAFYTTDRVMTVSFHQSGIFPGTGDVRDIGHEKGKYYSVNVPLKHGMNDESYDYLFKPIVTKVMEVFQPEAIVLQCGADSLYGDRLGSFNLSVRGHAECVKFLRSFNVPLMLLGGGGYRISSVARCWCYETGVAVGLELPDGLPEHEYLGYYGPDFTLHFQTGDMLNWNTRTQLDSIKEKVLENLTRLVAVPSVQFMERPPDRDFREEEKEDMEVRGDITDWDYGGMHDHDSEEDNIKDSEQGTEAVSEPAFPSRVPPSTSEQNREGTPEEIPPRLPLRKRFNYSTKRGKQNMD